MAFFSRHRQPGCIASRSLRARCASAAIPNDYYIEVIYPFPLNPLGIPRFRVTWAGFSIRNEAEPSRFVILITGADELVEWR
jgi:hypothetical protein